MHMLTLSGIVTSMSTGDYETTGCARVSIKHEKGSSSLTVPLELSNVFTLGLVVTIHVQDCR